MKKLAMSVLFCMSATGVLSAQAAEEIPLENRVASCAQAIANLERTGYFKNFPPTEPDNAIKYYNGQLVTLAGDDTQMVLRAFSYATNRWLQGLRDVLSKRYTEEAFAMRDEADVCMRAYEMHKK